MEARATFGGGCFWCLEAVFKRVPGVLDAVSGYAGGHTENPDYRGVCTGATGHAEVVQLRFDPGRITYAALVDLFFLAHDPTTPNRQGADMGTQYRSIILCHDEDQARTARERLAVAQQQQDAPIVTEVTPLQRFYPAEPYHQDYFAQQPGAPYCRAVIIPKLHKLRAVLPA